MKKIWQLLKQHLAADFSWKLYVTAAVFLAAIVIINYSINLENGIIDKHTGKPIRILLYFVEMSVVYFGMTIIVFSFNKTLHYFKSTRYWLISLVGLIFLSISIGFPYNTVIATKLTGDQYYLFRWTYGIVINSLDFLTQTLPLFVFAWFFEKRREHFGVTFTNVDLKPYWQILMIVAPLVIIASFESGFKNYYPTSTRYEIPDEKNLSDLPSWFFTLTYELAYGMDFFNVEFIFRGLMVIGVSQVIGKEAILPMVAAYCALHFGKPLGECISSIFGGYLLGVVALYTRNIWGGVIVHVGLAWMMEIAAFIQKAMSS